LSGGNWGADWVAEDAYTPAVYDLYISWSKLLCQSAAAKVEIVFGAVNRKMLEREIEHRHKCITLWADPLTKLHIQYQDISKVRIARLILFVHHPEHFFYNWKLRFSIEIDTALTTATKFTSLDLECSYFENRVRYYTSIRFDCQLTLSSRNLQPIAFPLCQLMVEAPGRSLPT